jgi:hypothetical protein
MYYIGADTDAAIKYRERMQTLEREEARRQRRTFDEQSEATSLAGDEEDSPLSSPPATAGVRLSTGDARAVARFLGEGEQKVGGGGDRVRSERSREEDSDLRKAPQVMGGVVFCGECGEPNKYGARYCSCGEPLVEDDDYSSPSKASLKSSRAREDHKSTGSVRASADLETKDGVALWGRVKGDEPADGRSLSDEMDAAGVLASGIFKREGGEENGGVVKTTVQRHRGAPKVTFEQLAVGETEEVSGDALRSLSTVGNARDIGKDGGGDASGRGGWKLQGEPKDESESDDDDSPRARYKLSNVCSFRH